MPVKGPTYFYIDPSKTATQSIIAMLNQYYGAEPAVALVFGAMVPADTFVFASVRDPYSRAISLWWSTCGHSSGDYYGWTKHCPDLLSMVRWLYYKEWERTDDPKVHKKSPSMRNITYTMSEWIAGVKLDYLIHYETLDADFRKLPFYTGQPEELPILNRKSNARARGKDEEYLTPEVIEAINEWCCDDFEHFGYKMRRP